MVTRSSMPLPSRATICCGAKSRSVAPHRRHAIHRTAVPSSQVPIHASEAGTDHITFSASSVVSTVGKRVGFRACMASMGRPSEYLSTSRERHSRVLRAWLGGSSDVSMHRQVGQKRLDPGFGGEEVFARPRAVETDESYDPLHTGALDVNGVVVQTAPVTLHRGVWVVDFPSSQAYNPAVVVP